MRAPHPGPGLGPDPEVLVGALGAKPEREGGDLRAAGVDVHAVQVVLDDQRRRRFAKLLEHGVVIPQAAPGQRAGRALVTSLPGLHVDREQQVERVQKEVPGPAGGIQDPKIARILPGPRPERLVDRADEVLAGLEQARSLTMHLHPRAAEGVVRQELHDVARREELVADGQLAAVPRRLALVAHLLALVGAVEVLVDPPDRLVVGPDPVQFGAVQRLEK